MNRRNFMPTLGTLALSLNACRSKGDREMQATAQTSGEPQTSEEVQTSEEPRDSTAPLTAEKLRASEKPSVANLEKWNFPKLAWSSKQGAFSRMKSSDRPGLVVIKGEWCPHCRKYAQIFSDPQVSQLTKSFELILLDNESGDATEWRQTGTYVPRTLFLDPQGQLDTSFTGPNPRYPYFFSANDKELFIRKMSEAKIKYGS